jgi:ATP-dependent exoDNAse (exonuclease V) beta subunit
LLARGLHVPEHLPSLVTVVEAETIPLTPEQLAAIERRDGDLFLDAGAGSGKTSVLVERFARSVVEDGIEPAAILTITFTEKAAAEMRERIRERLRQLGALDAARATEGAFISTIHGFCARVLRTHALTAGIDPAFVVLDELEAGRLADAAFEAALVALADEAPGAVELIASYGASDLRAAMQRVYAELRPRGERSPRLPALPEPPELVPLARSLMRTASLAAASLREVPEPSTKVAQALERIARVEAVLARSPAPWPGDLDALRLPGGNGAALSTPVCIEYAEALARYREACAHAWAVRVVPLFDRLLTGFGSRYEQLKREQSGLDFEDLELLCRDLLRDDEELRDRYCARFERVMVDELQDTNAVQLELIDAISTGNLFTVGDAQQAIYAFRHADVELFERRGEELAAAGARATLRMNFRSRPEILEVIDRVFAGELGEGFRPLVAGRDELVSGEPRVELLVVDREEEWGTEELAAPWRVAEARALAGRVAELVSEGISPRDVVVLTRATTDIRVYERALEERGVPTYLIGGRGYWSHPQVVDLLCYLRLLANPRDEEALYMVLASPLVGASIDALVLLAAAARESGRDPWWVLREPGVLLDEFSAEDRERIVPFVAWLAAERAVAARKGVEELVERVLEQTGYDLAVLAMRDGQRRLANVRKLMRLGREYAAADGPDLRGFLELVRRRASPWSPDPDESEAPVESEALDAVRLMTIHRAKGLEFDIVCVADLGRGPRWSGQLVRLGRDGRVGLRLARPGTGRREGALAYEELGEEQRERAAREERRLFYVAMTRARERLILSGGARLDLWGSGGGSGPPIAWLGPALVPDVSGSAGISEGVRFRVFRPSDMDLEDLRRDIAAIDRPGPVEAPVPTASAVERLAITSLSYTSLAAYQRCGYRFYVERVLGVPGPEPAGGGAAAVVGALRAADRGTTVHALLERIDFRRPVIPGAEAIAAAAPRAPGAEEVEEIAVLLGGLVATPLVERLGRATRVSREQRFSFPLGEVLIVGTLDVIAFEPDRTLIVDYKTDRLLDREPSAIVAADYAIQQLVYALAALRAGAEQVEVAHVFLEAPGLPVAATFTRAERDGLEQQLTAVVDRVTRHEFGVTETPHRALCHGCPAEGGLCSWPLEVTRREQLDQLF